MPVPLQTTKKSVNGVSSSTLAFDNDVTAGSLLIVAQATYDPAQPAGETITTPTDTLGNDYRQCLPETVFNSASIHTQHQAVFYAIANGSGANTVAFGQENATGVYTTVILAEFPSINGVPALTGFASGVSNSANTAADSGAIITDAGVLLIGFCSDGTATNPATFTEGGIFLNVNKETDTATTQVCALEYAYAAAQGSVSATYTINSARWGCQLVAFLPVESDAADWVAPTPSDSGITTGTQSVIGFPEIRPTAIYDAAAGAGGQTIVPCVTGADSDLSIAVYDHDTQAWLSPHLAIDTTTTSDGHQSVCIVLGGDGKYHLFWGCHDTALKYVRSTNGHDPTAWSVQANVANNATYPSAWVSSGGLIMVFYRAGVGHTSDWSRVTSADHGATWSAPVVVLDGTASNSWYLSAVQSGDDVHVIVTWDDEANSLGTSYPHSVHRYGLYHFSITDFGGAETYTATDGTTLTLPITKTDLDAHCVVRAAASPLFDQEPRITMGLDGKPAILCVRGTDINHVVSFMRSTGTAWTSPVTVCASGVDYVADCGLLANVDTHIWVAFVIRRGSSALLGDADANGDDTGGNVDEYRSADDGVTWARKGVVSSRTHINFIADVIDGIAPISYLLADYVAVGAATGHIFGFVPGTPLSLATAALTGTALAGITEADLVAGGNTVIVTVTGDTFIPA